MPKGVYERTAKHKKSISDGLVGHKVSEETKGKIRRTKEREKHPNWKGGLLKKKGYIYFLPSDDKFSCMKGYRGYIRLHRLVMAEHLQRPLTKEEVVHHIDGDITNNEIENLMLFKNKSEHKAHHHKSRKIDKGGMYL